MIFDTLSSITNLLNLVHWLDNNQTKAFSLCYGNNNQQQAFRLSNCFVPEKKTKICMENHILIYDKYK